MKLKLKPLSAIAGSSSGSSRSSSGRSTPVRSPSKDREAHMKTTTTSPNTGTSTSTSTSTTNMRFPLPFSLRSPKLVIQPGEGNDQMMPASTDAEIVGAEESWCRSAAATPTPKNSSLRAFKADSLRLARRNGEEASMEEYKEIFDQFDANKDGKISAEEVKAVMRRLGEGEGEGEATAEWMVEAADRDGDGYVDLGEFIELYRRVEAQATSNEELKEVFLVFDLDRDGQITAEELHEVLRKLGDAETTVEDCRIMVRGVDKKGHGHVDFDDFKLMMMMST